MNTPSPLVPQGTFADKGKSQIRLTVFAILAIHMVFLGLLLIAGCNKKPTDQADTGLPPVPAVEQPWPTPSTSAPPIVSTPPPLDVPPIPPSLTPSVVVATPPAPPPPEAGAVVEHTIAKGESFYTLGKRYGVGYKAIAEANPGVNPTRLKIGDKIKIPSPKKMAGTAPDGLTAPAAGESGGVRTYKVKSGDNLMKIASAYGVKVKELRVFNNLKTDQIKVGQTLKIPAKPAPATAETVPPPPAVPPPPLLTPPPSAGTR
jgi:LysM repeat protein